MSIDTWYAALGGVMAIENGTISAVTEKFKVDAIGNRHWLRQEKIREALST